MHAFLLFWKNVQSSGLIIGGHYGFWIGFGS